VDLDFGVFILGRRLGRFSLVLLRLLLEVFGFGGDSIGSSYGILLLLLPLLPIPTPIPKPNRDGFLVLELLVPPSSTVIAFMVSDLKGMVVAVVIVMMVVSFPFPIPAPAPAPVRIRFKLDLIFCILLIFLVWEELAEDFLVPIKYGLEKMVSLVFDLSWDKVGEETTEEEEEEEKVELV
jgi:hypothetical protein